MDYDRLDPSQRMFRRKPAPDLIRGPAPDLVRGGYRSAAKNMRHSTILAERRGKVGDEVVRVLDADREPDQGIADAEARAHLPRH